jgi:alcohol dehydrogenase
MQAVVFDGQLRLARTHPTPALTHGEAIIRPHLMGICNTDLEIIRGYKGFHGVLGHEFVGTVVACEDSAWVGQRVVGEINAACMRCATCRRGDTSHCPERTTLGISRRDGVMAEQFSLPVACLHHVPAALSDEAAVFVEPLAAAVEVLEQSHVRPSDRVAVVGDGKLGLLCAQVLRLPGCEVTLVGRHPERWPWLQSLGLRTQSSDMGASPTPRAELFDLVVDCTGSPAGIATAQRLVRPRGRLIVKSTVAAESRIDLTAMVVAEVQVLGSRCGPFAPALRLLERGLVHVTPMVAARYPLGDALAAFGAAHRHLKVLLEV